MQAAAAAGSNEQAEAQRWFGGFAFGEDHAAEGAWTSFPAALFQRPEFELERSGKGCRLTVRGFPAAGESRGEAYRRLVGSHYPAMALLEVKGLLEPRAKVEIEADAVLPAGDSSPAEDRDG